MNIGLYFGAFNPVHNGHTEVANYVLNNSILDKVWLVLTPQSPHKTENILIDFNHRYKMLEIACKNYKDVIAIDIEKNLPTPNYSINTLDYLKKRNNINKYSLIIGNDNLKKLSTWKEYSRIIDNHKIYVYPRDVYDENYKLEHKNINYLKAPYIDISGSTIRKKIISNQMDDLKINANVFKYLINNNIKINV